MGKGSILTEKQKIILGEFKKDDRMSSLFYFTGGTALSEFYLKHRESADLDFFSNVTFDPQILLETVNSWSIKYDFTAKPTFNDPVHVFFLSFKDGDSLKIDFSRYPYRQIEEPKDFGGLRVDSLYDIAANKLLTVNQRTEVKDFVDLYYLMKEFNFWQLKDGVIAKFNMEMDPFLTAVDFMKVEKFQAMPKMFKKLDLETLKNFFRKQAKKLGAEILYSGGCRR